MITRKCTHCRTNSHWCRSVRMASLIRHYRAKLMKTNPPAAEDAPMVAKMAKIGLVPGQDFDPSKLGAFDKEAIKAVPKLAQVKILEYFKQAAVPVNGWSYI